MKGSLLFIKNPSNPYRYHSSINSLNVPLHVKFPFSDTQSASINLVGIGFAMKKYHTNVVMNHESNADIMLIGFIGKKIVSTMASPVVITGMIPSNLKSYTVNITMRITVTITNKMNGRMRIGSRVPITI